jgi:DNA-binding MarR family transcriptional regulator
LLRGRVENVPARPPSGIAWLLSRLGARASSRLAARLADHDLTPPHVGILRVVGQQPGLSQQALAQAVGVAPSRIVALVDELESRGLVERRRSATDRRNYQLHLRASARDRLARIRRVMRDHDEEITAGLTATEKAALVVLLQKLADHDQP